MTISGQLQPGPAQVVDRSTGALIGYAYTVENGQGQLQRWLLHRSPQNDFDVRPAPPEMASWTLGDFRANVPSLWQPGSHYVLAQSDIYAYGSTYGGVVWTKIPSEAALPDPNYPQVPGNYQLDPTPTKILSVLQQAQQPGIAFSMGGLSSSASVEYWMLPPEYVPGGGTSSITITTGSQSISSFQDFLDTANQTWGPGCVFSITGCVNYTGTEPPAMP